ncbi:MAG: hypothetical protein KGL19_06775, partial [Bacteroidota bacterium]|nr:hypothetical protein [Bacteroidota bacterium]
MKQLLVALSLFITLSAIAQKKPLEHSVYDAWQSIGEKLISNNGKFVVYTINPQEGDGSLIIQQTDGKKLFEIERGYAAKITEDSKFVICKIKPTFLQTRTAKIQKKKADEMPKDSLAIVDINSLTIERIARIKNFKTPEKSSAFVVYLSEKNVADNGVKAELDSLSRIKRIQTIADSLSKTVDSLRNKLLEVQTKGIAVLQSKKENKPAAKANEETIEEGTELTVLNLQSHQKRSFKLVNDYVVSKTGNNIVIKTSKKNNDTLSKACVIKYDLLKNQTDTLLKGLNDAKSFAFDEAGDQLAFVAERDSSTKALQKFYKLYYYKTGFDSARSI